MRKTIIPTLYKAAFTSGILFIALALFSSGYILSEYRAKGNIKYLNGLHLDLPEEIGTIGKKLERLQAFRQDDTIFIQFPD